MLQQRIHGEMRRRTIILADQKPIPTSLRSQVSQSRLALLNCNSTNISDDEKKMAGIGILIKATH